MQSSSASPWPPPGAPLPPRTQEPADRIGLTLTVVVALAPLAGLGICAQYVYRAWRGLGIRPGDLPISLGDIAPAASFIGFWVLMGAATTVGLLAGIGYLTDVVNRSTLGRSFDRALDRPLERLARVDRRSRRTQLVLGAVVVLLLGALVVTVRTGYRQYIDTIYETAASADVFMLHTTLSLFTGMFVGFLAIAAAPHRMFRGAWRAMFGVVGIYGLFLTSVITVDLADIPRLKLETATSSSAGLLPFNLGASVRYVSVVPVGDDVAGATGLAAAQCVVTFGTGPAGVVLRAVTDDGAVEVWKIDPQLVMLRNAPACSEENRRLLWTSPASRLFPE